MLDFDVVRDTINPQAFYTNGFKSLMDCEFQIVLDKLTANRVGNKAALKWFSLLLKKLEGLSDKSLKDGYIFEDFTLIENLDNPTDIKIVTSNKAILKRVDDRNGILSYQLVLIDPKGYWPWEDKCSPDWKYQWLEEGLEMNKEKLFELVVTTEKPSDWEEIPLEVREVEEKAYMILGEYAWILREVKGTYYIETKNINNLDKTLMFKIRTSEEDYMVIDVLSNDFEELEKYKIMFYTERNRELFFDELKDKESRWVIKGK